MGIKYEQPLNELVRTILRLEYLFQKLNDNIDDKGSWSHHLALVSIIDIVSILDRPDLRSKLTKEFHRYIANLNRMKQAPNVDENKLSSIVEQFQYSIEILHNKHGKFGQRLRENEFLSSMRNRLVNPGGTCPADAPIYHYWVHQSEKERHQQLQEWTELLSNIHNTMELMLGLIRQSGTTTTETAQQGFYQKALDPIQPYQLISIELPETSPVFPEISAGKHRAIIYFYNHSINARPEQSQEDIEFKLTLCAI